MRGNSTLPPIRNSSIARPDRPVSLRCWAIWTSISGIPRRIRLRAGAKVEWTIQVRKARSGKAVEGYRRIGPAAIEVAILSGITDMQPKHIPIERANQALFPT